MKLKTLYDRTNLIRITTETVRHLVLMGIALVLLLLITFLGDWRMSLIAALSIPVALLFAFGLMEVTGRSANLISLGSIDFGILVDAVIIGLDQIYRRLQDRSESETAFDAIAQASAETARPVLFSVIIIIVALFPLFTMSGVPGQILGLCPLLTVSPWLVLRFLHSSSRLSWRPTEIYVLHVSALELCAGCSAGTLLCCILQSTLPGVLLFACIGLFAITMLLMPLMGGEFMPKLEEGNLWVRATLPQDVSF